MAELKSSWALKEEISRLKVSDTLMSEIKTYIYNKDKICTEKDRQFSNVIYRANLHFIIDNHTNETRLIKELKTINNVS